MIRFVAKLLSTAGGFGPSATPGPHSVGALADAQGFQLTPGVDPEQRLAVVSAAFLLAPVHLEANRPREGDDPRYVARFGAQLLGDAKQSGNPVRRHFLSREVDLLDAPDLAPWDDEIRAIVLASDVRFDTIDRPLRAPYRRDPRHDFWPEEWDDDVRAALDGWKHVEPARVSWCKLLLDARFSEHLRVRLPVFGARANMPAGA